VAAIVTVSGLEKRFGDVRAVDGVSFEIAEGELFGLLGPNGAGKTTTISMISCLLTPDAGDVIVDGRSVRSDTVGVRRVLGVVPQEIALYPTLTALENLRFWGKMYGLAGKELDSAVVDALELAGLADRAKERIETYSGGMKRRINIAAGVLHRPKVLLMDEPTVGIDPQSRAHILGTVKRLNDEGTTVLYTSHYMEEVEELCDRIAIIDHGKKIADGTLPELRALVGDEDVVRIGLDTGALAVEGDAPAESEMPKSAKARKVAQAAEEEAATAAEALLPDPAADAAVGAVRGVRGVTRAERVPGGIEAIAQNAGTILAAIVAAVTAAGVGIRSVEVVEPDLESVFLHLTGRGLRD